MVVGFPAAKIGLGHWFLRLKVLSLGGLQFRFLGSGLAAMVEVAGFRV